MTGAARGAALIAGRELRALIRSPRGLLFAAVVAGLTVAVALSLDAFLRRIAEETGVQIEAGAGAATWSADAMIRSRLEPYAEGRPLAAAALRRELSIPGAMLAWVLGFAVPWLIVIAGHARVCEDQRSGYVRFLFLRLHRGAYYAGKLGALWLFAAAVTAAAIAANAMWWSSSGVAAWNDVGPLAGRAVLFTFPYAALVLGASALARSTVGALSLSTGSIFGLGLGAAVADAWTGAAWAQLWVGQWTSELWAGEPMGALVHSLTGLVLAGLGYALVRWRDA